MHYYLSTYVGAGTSLDPYRALGADQPGAGAIDLRPDPTVLAGRCLLGMPIRQDPVGARYFGDDPRVVLSNQIRARLGNDLGLTLAESRFDAIALELLTDHARTDGTRWKPLRPERTTGRWRIYLGDVLVDLPRVAGGATITEDWNCADSASLTCDLTWTEIVGTSWGIVSNAAKISGNVTENVARADSDLASDDHYAQATISSFTNGASPLDGDVIARKDGTATQTFYLWQGRIDLFVYRLFKDVAGSFTQLGSDVAEIPTAGDIIKLQCDGSTIKGYRNGTEKISATDTAIVDNLRCGIRGYCGGAAQDVVLDDWSAADLAAAATHKGLHLLGVGH